ncbi:hypothetical protein MKZ38_007581 [Zalerion maritima]|uniref:Nucleolar complex-associated protein 3 n=1 Tax=Zalerion maritima TaxID=339359 RepID=A0AAD5WVV7_9PEZI|nr:hypothetical protein MKZ38_007581 [Zalerion maritima]
MAPRPSKRRKISPQPESRRSSTNPDVQKSFFKSTANWDLEENYAAKRKKVSRQESSKLPIKTVDGRLQHGRVDPIQDGEEEEGNAGRDGIDDGWISGLQKDSEKEPVPARPEKQQIKEAKEQLANIATAVNEEPEDNTSAFKALSKIAQSPIVGIQKLALVTQMAVYKDVIPGYRIRPAEEDVQEKLSKDVRKLRAYEQALVKGYQGYIKDLARCAKLDPYKSRGLPEVAVTCACTLVTSVPHFNFRGDLLRIVVGKLSKLNVDDGFVKSRSALQTLFREDEDGNACLEAVSILNKMMKARDFRVDESVVNLLLHLKLLSEYSREAQDHANGNFSGAQKQRKQQRQFRTKRERKQMKEQKALEKDMALADAQVNHEERERVQSETLRLVFASYFRILKLRLPHLMGAVLEGLARYAHLINMDFFGDLLEAMRDLVKHARDDDAIASGGRQKEEVYSDDEDHDHAGDALGARNTSREALLCTVTAFALLEGQDAAKARNDPQLDLPFFQNHLYQTLFPLAVNPDLELNNKSLRLVDPDAAGSKSSRDRKINLQTTTVLLLRCLTAALLPQHNMRAVPAVRLAAFTKQLLTASLHMPEKSCRALLVLLCDVAKMHGKKVAALWNTEERLGDGAFRASAPTPETSNPFAATIWEGELLRKHFCPEVREGITVLEKAMGNAARGC